MTEQFLVEIFVKTFLSVIEIIIWLAVIIKVLRILAVLTPGNRQGTLLDWSKSTIHSSLPSPLLSWVWWRLWSNTFGPRLPYVVRMVMVMRMMGDSLGVSGVEGDTKLSSRLGSAARAVAAAAGGEPQLAVTKDSLPGPVAVSQSDNRANITTPATPHLNILISTKSKNISVLYSSSVSVCLCSVGIWIKIETYKPHNLAECNYSCNKNL